MEQQLESDIEMMNCGRCGKPTIKRPKKEYCSRCSTIVNKESNKEYILKNGRIPKKSKTKTVCKCPLCGKLHKKLINWVGRGIPRIYCENCLTRLEGLFE